MTFLKSAFNEYRKPFTVKGFWVLLVFVPLVIISSHINREFGWHWGTLGYVVAWLFIRLMEDK